MFLREIWGTIFQCCLPLVQFMYTVLFTYTDILMSVSVLIQFTFKVYRDCEDFWCLHHMLVKWLLGNHFRFSDYPKWDADHMCSVLKMLRERSWKARLIQQINYPAFVSRHRRARKSGPENDRIFPLEMACGYILTQFVM